MSRAQLLHSTIGSTLTFLLLVGCGAILEPSATPRASLAPTRPPEAVKPTQSLPEHRIGVRVVDGIGQFYDRLTGERFLPRGLNYIRLGWQDGAFTHSTFNTDAYDPNRAEAALAALQAYGFNVVRVFVIDGPTGLVGEGRELSDAYLDNLADFLHRASGREIFVWLTLDWLPGGKYGELSNRECCEDFGSANLQIMTAGAIEALGLFYANLHRELVDRGAPVDHIFTYQIRNEAYFDGNEPPLSFDQGSITAANGRSYDMGSPADRQRLMDESLVHYIDRARARILQEDPTALVSIGFFVPQGPVPARIGDPRWIETRPAIWESTADFVDLHLYPGFELDLAEHVVNFGIDGMEKKPIVMGEFGAFRHLFPSPDAAAAVLRSWQIESCSYGFDGWLLWHWDTDEDEALWNGLNDDGAIARALAPSERNDPCRL